MGWQDAPIIVEAKTAEQNSAKWQDAPLIEEQQALPEAGPMNGPMISTVSGRTITQPEIPSGGGNKSFSSTEELIRPVFEFGGMAAGGAVGTSAAGPAGSVAGGGLGYAAGKNIADMIFQTDQPASIPGAIGKTAKDVTTGATIVAEGEILGKTLGYAAEKSGSVISSVLGRMTGTGKATIDEAVKSGKSTGITFNPLQSATDFDNALRGNVTGEEIVKKSRVALNTIKNNRQIKYQADLAKLANSSKPIDLQPIKQHLQNSLQRFGFIAKDGGVKPIYTASSLGGKAEKDIKEIVGTVNKWGLTKGDDTALGLDTLKRYLDDFYSESSNARAFVHSLRNEVKDNIVNAVPEYARMTKDYAMATKVIKDVEAGLMMRKQGMTGRIVADQTLRRLLSTVKDNYELRRDLVKTLSENGEDIGALISGYAMRSPVPLGIAGTGPAIIGEAALAKLVSPAFWPVLAASSPRLSGEFLRMYGKTLAEIQGISPKVGQVISYKMSRMLLEDKEKVDKEKENR